MFECPRGYETTVKREYLSSPVTEKIGKGLAIGRDDAGQVAEYRPGMDFIGFAEGNLSDPVRIIAVTRGSVFLNVPGAADRLRGKTVYVLAGNQFSLKKEKGASEVGKIRHSDREDWAAVAFRRVGDDRPLNLVV